MTLERVDSLQVAAKDRVGRAATLQWDGFLLRTVGAMGRARGALFAAVAEGEASGNLSPVAWAYSNLASIARSVGDPAAASEYTALAESMLREQRDNWGLAGALGIRGSIAQLVGDYDLAREKYSEALEWYVEANSATDLFGTHHALAQVAITEQDWGEAERELGLAADVARERGLGPWEIGLLPSHATIRAAEGDMDEAARLLTDYVAQQQSPVRIHFALTQRAAIHARLGDLDRAGRDLTEALDQLDFWRSRLGAVDLRRYAFQIHERIDEPLAGSATVVAALVEGGRIAQAFQIAERQRARDLLEQMVRAEALRGTDGDSIPASSRSVDVRSAESIMESIPDDSTAIVEYVTGSGAEPITVFALTRDGIEARTLAPVDSVTADIGRMVALLSQGSDVGSLDRRLGDALLRPTLEGLPERVRRLSIVSGGVLHRVPFDALRMADHRLVVERYAVSLAPSATAAVDLWNRMDEPAAARLLAFGDVAFPTDGGTGASAVYFQAFDEEGGLPRLPSSRREARSVDRFASASEVRMGADASESFLKGGGLDRYNVLHFATHARVDDWAVTRTALVLSPGGGEDGFVAPGDLAALKLDADLVVLSACRTSAGVVIRGEGVQGLTAPLLRAGARSVLATAWPVGDRTTTRFIEDFYGAMAGGSTVGDALREAKLVAIGRGEPTATWAAFTLVGDPHVRLVLRASSPWGSYAFLLVILGLGAVTYGWRASRTGRGVSVPETSAQAK